MRLTHQQMLAHWRRAHGLEPERSDCSVEIFEGMDTTVSMSAEMRQWYLNLLDTAPLRLLAPVDISSRLRPEPVAPGMWSIPLPADVRRLISISAAELQAPAAVLRAEDHPQLYARQFNRYSRASCAAPVAFVLQGARMATLFCAGTPTLTLTSATAVTDSGEEFYDFDESALSLLYLKS